MGSVFDTVPTPPSEQGRGPLLGGLVVSRVLEVPRVRGRRGGVSGGGGGGTGGRRHAGGGGEEPSTEPVGNLNFGVV